MNQRFKAPIVGISTCLALLQVPMPFRIPHVTTGGGSTMLSASNFSCDGAFTTPTFNVGNASSGYPVAMRYDSGHRQYFIYGGRADVLSFVEPTLLPCSTDPTLLNRADTEQYWGTYNVNAGEDHYPGNASTTAQGMKWDSVTSQLLLSWGGNYTTPYYNNSFAAATLNPSGHTIDVNGCWGLSGPTQAHTAGPVLLLPSDFVTANSAYLPPGARWGPGISSMNASVTAGISNGPAIFAIVPPAPNACEATTDHLVSGFVLLEDHEGNGIGPNCDATVAAGPNCTPAITDPTSPYPLQIAYTDYSKFMYATDWEPYGGHGWSGFGVSEVIDWYQDATYNSVIGFLLVPEGWMNTTVVSSTDVTHAVITSTSTHDGHNLNPGDHIWIQTCTPGVDPNGAGNDGIPGNSDDTVCATGNGDHTSEVVLTSVNTSTGAIVYTVSGTDFGGGNHYAVPGGVVWGGCAYTKGTPSCSRNEMRLQIFDPAQYSAVLAGTLPVSEVVATDDQEIDTTLLTGLGAPSTGNGIQSGHGGYSGYGIAGVIADPLGAKVALAITNIGNFGSVASDAIYLFSIHSSPAPSFLDWLVKELTPNFTKLSKHGQVSALFRNPFAISPVPVHAARKPR